MAEQGCLLSSYTGKTGVGGSNPPLSATSQIVVDIKWGSSKPAVLPTIFVVGPEAKTSQKLHVIPLVIGIVCEIKSCIIAGWTREARITTRIAVDLYDMAVIRSCCAEHVPWDRARLARKTFASTLAFNRTPAVSVQPLFIGLYPLDAPNPSEPSLRVMIC